MIHLKLEGGTKELIEKTEKFLDEIKFEETVGQIVFEEMALGVDYKETPTYKKCIKAWGIKNGSKTK